MTDILDRYRTRYEIHYVSQKDEHKASGLGRVWYQTCKSCRKLLKRKPLRVKKGNNS